MKRILIFSIAILAIISCNKEDKLGSGYALTFEQVAAKDYDYMTDNAQDGFFFYEIQCALTGSPARLETDEIQVASTCTVSEAKGRTVYFIYTDLETGEQNVEKVENDWWIGDFDMGDPRKVNITFAEAVKKLKEQTIYEIPDTDLCTFSKPTVGPNVNPRYIFGSIIAGFVYVDAITGEIGTMTRESAGLQSVKY